MLSHAVICIGNRYVNRDALGCRVLDCLNEPPFDRMAAEAQAEVIDGGLCGLDLLRMLEGRQRVVFVDALATTPEAGDIAVINGATIAAQAGSYGHSAGLPYLLAMASHVCTPPLPAVFLVGTCKIAGDDLLHKIACRSLEVCRHGRD